MSEKTNEASGGGKWAIQFDEVNEVPVENPKPIVLDEPEWGAFSELIIPWSRMVGPVYERVRHEEYCEKLDPEECELLDLLANLCDETLTYKVQFS